MNVLEAIARADRMRPNQIDDQQKADWLYRADRDFCLKTGNTPAEKVFPQDSTLSAEEPFDDVYVLNLMVLIDLYNEDSINYQDDVALWTQRSSEYLAWWRRTHKPASPGGWRNWI